MVQDKIIKVIVYNYTVTQLSHINEYPKLKRKETFNKLTQLITDKDLENIEKSMKEFRKHFKLDKR